MTTIIDNKESSSKCPLCGATGFFSHKGRDLLYNKFELYTYMKCATCSAEYIHPMPDSKTISNFYPDVYYEEKSKKKKSIVKLSVLKYKYNYSHIKISFIFQLIAPAVALFFYKSSIPFLPDARGLDIGCGNGRFIKSMNKLGWQFEGVEFGSVAVDICRQSGLKVFNGELKDAKFSENSFDIICARHLIEHIPDPDSLLNEISRILKPQGILIIRTPNSKAFGRNWFGRNWFPDDIPRHLILFNLKNLNMMAQRYKMYPVISKSFTSPKAFLNSIDYLIGNRKKPSKRQKLRRFFAKFFVLLAKITNKGDELFVAYKKNKL